MELAGRPATRDGRATDGPGPGELEVRGLAPAEHDRVLDWLDQGLRDGRKGRLRAEAPFLADEGGPVTHRVAWMDGHPAAHAVARTVRARVDGRAVDLGMIGWVYTDPAWRRRGLGSVVVEACTQALADAGAQLAVLWSDRRSFYGRLGFLPAGRERLLVVDGNACRAAARRFGGVDAVGPPADGDWERLEILYARKRAHVERAPGELRALATAPDCELRVARAGRTPVAYAAMGRGDDFRGVVHEWAGSPAGVTACLEAFLAATTGPLLLLSGPGDAQPVAALHGGGAAAHPGPLGLVRLLDAAGLWGRLTAGFAALSHAHLRGEGGGYRLEARGGAVALTAAEALALLIGPALPDRVRAAVDAETARAVARVLPAPLFLWGFDSI